VSEPGERLPTELRPEAEPLPQPSWRPWGAGWTLGLTLAVLACYFAGQFLLSAIIGVVAAIGLGVSDVSGWVEAHVGFLVAITTGVTAPLFALLVVLLARARGSIRGYLGLRWARWKPALGWAIVIAAFLCAFDLLGAWLGRPPIPDFMRNVYQTGEPLWVLWIALVIMAPLFEELLFRGFLIPGLEQRWGAVVAVLLSGGIFAVIHLQYDWFDVCAVFGLGAFLGAARVTTRSTLLPMVLHAGVNLVATVQAHWLLGGG